ncbi:MAG TPA: helix-turn-helix domain-containing protein [Anaerolineae bacterium]|nr:helix-turn-helix domain-containing protein [Anaerolineae bacterium]
MGECISTNDVNEGERLNYWNDLVCRTFLRVEVTSLLDGPFFGTISTNQLAYIKFVEVTTQPSLVTRSKQFIAQTTEAYVKAIYQLAGESTFNQEGRTAHLGPGNWVFFDCMRPYSLAHLPAHDLNSVLVVQLPKSIFCARLPNIELLTGYTLSSKTGLGKVTYNFVQSTLREVAGIKPESAPPLAETLVDLLATNLSETLQPAKAVARSQAVTLLEVKSFIHHHLADPNLSSCMIAKALNISKSYLYLLFQGENTTVNRYIWDLRLEKSRADLANPLHRHRTITEIAFAWGFNNNTHFSRMFKERYGLSARAYRC